MQESAMVAYAQRDDPALTPADLISAYEQGVEEHLLRPADVPGRLPGVGALEGTAVGNGHGHSPVVLSLHCTRHASLLDTATERIGPFRQATGGIQGIVIAARFSATNRR